MNPSNVSIKLLALAALALSAAGCTGSVNLDVTDAPVDKASKVVVQFSGATFQPTGADAITVNFNPPLSIDLLALKDGNTSSLISNKKMRDGNYDSVTLTVNATGTGTDSYVILTSDPDTKIPLTLTNGSGLTITGGFSVDKDVTQNYVIDFDLRKSVSDPLIGTTAYQLNPALRLVNKDTSGSIAGTVTGAGATGCSPAVYVYQGSDATAGDQGSSNPPYTSTLIRLNTTTTPSTYTYTVSFLPPGNYTLAATCSADEDTVGAASEIILSNTVNVTVQKGITTAQNFAL